MTMASFDVGVNVLVVPDGVREEKGRTVCRLSLSVTPGLKPAGGRTVDIREWPRKIDELAADIRVAVGRLANSNPSGVEDVRCVCHVASDVHGVEVESATKMWQALFAPDGNLNSGFQLLMNTLGPPSEVKAADAAGDFTPALGSYDGTALRTVVESLYASATAATLATRANALSAPLAKAATGEPFVSTPLPSDPNRLSPPWWRVFSERWLSDVPAGGADLAVANAGRRSLRAEAIEQMKDAARAALANDPAPVAQTATDVTSLATRSMEAFFEDQIENPEFWRSGNARTATAADASAAVGDERFRQELARLETCWAIDETIPNRPNAVTAADTTLEDQRNAAARKLSGLLSYPTLAKYLRLVIDVEIAWSCLEGVPPPQKPQARRYGTIAAFFDGWWPGADCAPVQEVEWTSWVCTKDSAPPYFGPCSRAEMLDPKTLSQQLYQDGLVNLRARKGDEARFVLQTLSTVNSVMSLKKKAEAHVEGADGGLLPADQNTRLPDMPTRGIVMLDRDAQAVVDREIRDSASTLPGVRISFIDDLTLGYRIDAALVEHDSQTWDTPERWRPMSARKLEYKHRDLAAFAKELAVEVRTREEGHVRLARSQKDVQTDTGPRRQITAFQELLTWTGESLGTPALHHQFKVDETDPLKQEAPLDKTNDLGISIDFDLPDERDVRPLPLRERRAYVFGARAYLVNGCGVPFLNARSRYATSAQALVLGDASNRPYLFQRRSEIPAPDVLLPHDEKLVTMREGSLATEVPGETIDTLVIRSGSRATPVARRFLVPPRSTFDLCEQAGTFDQDPFIDERRPPGAFEDAVRAKLCSVTGTFPVAREGTVRLPCEKKPGEDSDTTERSRGSVLVLDNSATRAADTPTFYPDPLGRRARARFAREGESTPYYAPLRDAVPFWGDAASPSDATPILVQLRKPRPNEQRLGRGWFDETTRTVRVRPSRGRALTLPALTVVLEPAEAIDLEFWCDSDCEDLCERLWSLSKPLELLEKKGKGNIRAVLASVLAAAPLAQVVSKRKVRIVHAVEKPLLAPTFKPEGDAFSLHAIVLTVAANARAGVTSPDRGTWQKYVEAHLDLPRSNWPSEAGGMTAFFVGQVALDRKSTGTLRCEAAWADFRATNRHYDKRTNLWRFETPQVGARLFAVDNISNADEQRPHDLCLLNDDASILKRPLEDGKLRSLSHGFGDTKARRLNVSLVGTSRFTDFFNKAGQAGIHDLAAAKTIELWVRATTRPAAPQIDRVLPVFTWSENIRDHGKRIEFSREAALRVYLKPETWPNQEGERLAVTFGPRVNSPAPLCAFENEVKEFGPFVTRWGADPIQRSGSLDELIPESAFSRHEPRANGLLPYAHEPVVHRVFPDCSGSMPAGSELTVMGDHFISGARVMVNGEEVDAQVKDDMTIVVPKTAKDYKCPLRVTVDNPTLPVSLLPYAPAFDEYEGLWYADIPVAHQQSYFPFVQMGLAFYQSHSITGLELSPPVTAWAQLPPRRDGTVSFIKDRRVLLEYHGVGFHETAREPEHAALRGKTDVPLLNVRLLRASTPGRVPRGADASIKWLPAVDERAQPVERLQIPAVARGEIGQPNPAPLGRDQEAWWAVDLTLPECRPEVRYALLIEEVELRPADSSDPAATAFACSDTGVAYPSELRERPLFSHIVDLGA